MLIRGTQRKLLFIVVFFGKMPQFSRKIFGLKNKNLLMKRIEVKCERIEQLNDKDKVQNNNPWN
jgi:hypothetical protein